MSTLYVLQEGAYLRKEGERIRATYNEEVILEMPLIKVDQVILFGPVQVSTQAMAELLKRGIEITFLSKTGRYRGRLQPAFSKNSILRKAQYAASLDSQKTLLIAKSMIYGKLGNMRTILRRALRENFSDSAIAEESIRRITAAIKKLAISPSLEEARGREGEGTAAYFYAFNHLIKADGYSFDGREKRPPTDPINALLSLGYVLLTNDLAAACNIVGFDPYIGYLHADKYGKPALALDLVEEWRPAMVDLLVLSVINKRMIRPDDFEVGMGNTYRLSKTGLKKFLQAYEQKKRGNIKHPIFGYKTTYLRCFELQARILAKFLQGEIDSYIPFLIK